jgi:hypothetical protein
MIINLPASTSLIDLWLELKSGHLAGNIVTCTQVFNPEKPVSLLFDACAAIDKLWGGTVLGRKLLAV